MRFWTFVLLTGFFLTYLPLPMTAQKSARSPKTNSARETETAMTRFIDRVIELTNLERVKAGAPPLKREETLTKAANWLAEDMAANNYFAHQDRQGRNIGTRLPDFGYTGYSLIAENIAGGQQTPEQVMSAWMHSPGHRTNLLNPELREIGVGYVLSPNSKLPNYWVQDFGTRRDVFPLIINNDARQTNSPNVQLYVHGDKWAQQARYSSDGVRWTEWEPFRSTRAWKLEAVNGKQTVYGELSNGKTTRRASATIELNLTPRSASISK